MKLINVGLVLILALGAATPLSAQSGTLSLVTNVKSVRKGEVIVEIKPGVSIDEINARYGTTTIEQIYGTNFFRLLTPKGKKQKKWRKKLSKDEDVLSASLNPVVTSPSLFGRSTFGFPDGFATPGLSFDDFLSQGELFNLLQLEEVNLRSRGAGVVVAVIDTGVDFSHPALVGRLWKDERRNAEIEGDGIDNDGDGLIDDVRGWDFIDRDNDPSEQAENPETTVAGHGTFIGGLIAMLAPDCRILPVRAFPSEGVTDAFTVASAVKYAADHGAHVINLSLGSAEIAPLLEDAINYARDRGIVMVAAVGNDNSEAAPQYPSSSPDVIAVAAIDLASRKAAFSNFGKHVDVSAPGAGLVSAYPGGGEAAYARWSGTSFAAPLASAEAALVLSADPNNGEVKKTIEDTVININEINPGFAGKMGKGRINPLGALRSLNADDARPALDIHSQINFIRGPGSDEARGKGSISVSNAKQELRLEFRSLSVRANYRLIINGNDLGANISANLGNLLINFSTEPGKRPLPEFLNPVTNIRLVELRDSLGRIVLQGEFGQNDGGPVVADKLFQKEARLISTGTLTAVGGKASVTVRADAQHLRIEAEGLTSGEGYRIMADGINLGIVIAQFGFARAFFASDGTGQPLPPAFGSVTGIRHIELQNARGQVVLQGDFRNSP